MKFQNMSNNAIMFRRDLIIEAGQVIEVENDDVSISDLKAHRRIKEVGEKVPIKEHIEDNYQTLDEWKKELEDIKGIGKKTANKIIKVYKTKKELIQNLDSLPFDDDENDLLRNTFGGE